jgi:hydroxymethylbilane synthase
LQEFGGGCHLALGMAVLLRSYGQIEVVKGLSPDGMKIESKAFYPIKKRPETLKVGRLEFSTERIQNQVSQKRVHCDGLFVARANAFSTAMTASVVWAAGVKTWEKLAAQGIWVHGSSEGLGEVEDPLIDTLIGRNLNWTRLTHDQADSLGDKMTLGAYQVKMELKSKTLDDTQAFVWKSASEFHLAVRHFPELKNRLHICGPGRTYDSIKKFLGSDQNIYIELNWRF